MVKKTRIHSGSAQAISRERTDLTPEGMYTFDDQVNIDGCVTAEVVTSAAWLLEIFQLEAGEIVFLNGSDEIRPSSIRFGVLYPPFSITRPTFRDTRARLNGFAACLPLPNGFNCGPVLIETENDLPTAVSARVMDFLATRRNLQRINPHPTPAAISATARCLIDENYLEYPSIGKIARRLDVSHAHLSRQFKKDFGISPSKYLHKLRVSDAAFRLAQGEEIITVSMDVGYNDLSRFYKQFRQITNASPSHCQRR